MACTGQSIGRYWPQSPLPSRIFRRKFKIVRLDCKIQENFGKINIFMKMFGVLYSLGILKLI